MRPTWAEVSLKILRHNFRSIQHHVGTDVTVCAVLKSNAFGHGVVECARALEEEGATWFAVTSTEEGVRLRDAGVTGRILLLTGYWQGEEEEVVKRQLTPSVWEPWHIKLLADVVDKLSCAPFPVHVKVDTGLARLGVGCKALPDLLQVIRSAPGLALEGVFTHLASAEVLDAPDVPEQMRYFQIVRNTVLKAGFLSVNFHMANSAALATRPATWKDMVRPGVGLFGYFPDSVSNRVQSPITSPATMPVLSWKTRIISLREVGANQRVGYNGTYVTAVPTRLAALPVGFADGLSRQLSSRGRAIVRDAFASIVGLIATDITLLDVTRIRDVSVGDEVILIGSTEHCHITAREHADIRGTAPDSELLEVLCGIGSRVRRQYIY
jgi:alanine racemase